MGAKEVSNLAPLLEGRSSPRLLLQVYEPGQVADIRSLIDSADGIVIQQPISSTTNDARAVA